MNNMLDDVLSFFITYKKEMDQLKWGQSIEVKCLKCGGKVKISKSSYNGHIHIKCENEDFILIQ